VVGTDRKLVLGAVTLDKRACLWYFTSMEKYSEPEKKESRAAKMKRLTQERDKIIESFPDYARLRRIEREINDLLHFPPSRDDY